MKIEISIESVIEVVVGGGICFELGFGRLFRVARRSVAEPGEPKRLFNFRGLVLGCIDTDLCK